MQTMGSTLALKLEVDVTGRPKLEYQWPHNKRTNVLKKCFEKITFLK